MIIRPIYYRPKPLETAVAAPINRPSHVAGQPQRLVELAQRVVRGGGAQRRRLHAQRRAPRRRAVLVGVAGEPAHTGAVQPAHVQVAVRLELVRPGDGLGHHAAEVRREEQPLAVRAEAHVVDPLPVRLRAPRRPGHVHPPQPRPVRPHQVDAEHGGVARLVPVGGERDQLPVRRPARHRVDPLAVRDPPYRLLPARRVHDVEVLVARPARPEHHPPPARRHRRERVVAGLRPGQLLHGHVDVAAVVGELARVELDARNPDRRFRGLEDGASGGEHHPALAGAPRGVEQVGLLGEHPSLGAIGAEDRHAGGLEEVAVEGQVLRVRREGREGAVHAEHADGAHRAAHRLPVGDQRVARRACAAEAVVPEARAGRREEGVVVVQLRVEQRRYRGELLRLEVEQLDVALRPPLPPRRHGDPTARGGRGEAVHARRRHARLGAAGLEGLRRDVHPEDAPPAVIGDAVEEHRALPMPGRPAAPSREDHAARGVGGTEDGDLRLELVEVERPRPLAVRGDGEELAGRGHGGAHVRHALRRHPHRLLAAQVRRVHRRPAPEPPIRLLVRGDEVQPAGPHGGAVVEQAPLDGRQRHGAVGPGAAQEEARRAGALGHERHLLAALIRELGVEVEGDAVRVAALSQPLGGRALRSLRGGDGEDVEAEAGDPDGGEDDRAGGLAAGLHDR
uniref:Uncharacterized protein n=1 Tax=Triticum urartu TaxID=4572 RepID=A0A8R7TE71_TRIUA